MGGRVVALAHWGWTWDDGAKDTNHASGRMRPALGRGKRNEERALQWMPSTKQKMSCTRPQRCREATVSRQPTDDSLLASCFAARIKDYLERESLWANLFQCPGVLSVSK